MAPHPKGDYTVKFSKEFILILVLVPLGTVAVAQTKSGAQTAKPKVVHQDEFFIVGIEARTTAAKETSAQGVIPQQWQKFMQEGVLQKIPNKADQNIYAVVTDFADKRYGEYSVVIGARVTDKSQVPAGLVLKTIPAGKYAIFQTDKGPAGQVVPAAWQKIADSEDKGELGSTRTYKADYELFDGQAMDPQNLQAELHVGVK
jgi:predicted transcriptional regulator YdeE